MTLTDYHCHLLPDIDDGAGSLDESLTMSRLLADAGYTRVHCTPHCIRGCYDTTARQVEDAVRDLQRELTAAGIALELIPGMEYYLDEHFPAQLEAPRPLGDTDLLLVEAPSQAHPQLINDNIFRIVRRGFTPLFAHPERCGWLAPDAEQTGLWAKAKGLLRRNPIPEERAASPLDSLRDMGCRFQANLGSFTGFYGSQVRSRARRLQELGIYGYRGSDGHGSAQLKTILSHPDAGAAGQRSEQP